MRNAFLISFILGAIFFIIGVVSLSNYGSNWDEPVHFGRGQAILQYFMTGKKDYEDLPPTTLSRRSYYLHPEYSYAFFEQKFDEGKFPITGAGHPPLSDILAAISNRIFYQTLGILGDIEAYHLYSVFLSSVLVGVIYFVMATIYNPFVGLVSALALALSPLLLGESRYNTKDVPEAAYYAFTILCVYIGVTRRDWKWIVLSSLFAGLAFGTKLNIVFAGISIGIWLAVFFVSKFSKQGAKRFFGYYRKILLGLVFFPVIPLIIYFASWPILWKDPINRFLYNLHYYTTVGTEGGSIAQFSSVFGLNSYAIQWILFSTPLIILFLAIVGILASFFGIKRNKFFPLLVLLWFLVPILRVSLPGLVIYGGVRQIMEYIPALAILSGLGAKYLVDKFNSNRLQAQMVIILSFIPIALKMISMYPNESVYFNPLIGGLKGAAQRDIPGWGNSLGSTYRQGAKWLNEHAEPNAKVGFVYELRSNIAKIDLRPDFEFSNQVRTAIQRKGEYIIGVTHQGTQEFAYHRKYLERFLDPVYTLSIEGVPVLKVWKNDLEHSKSEYQASERVLSDVRIHENQGNIVIDLLDVKRVTKVVVQYSEADSCMSPTSGYFTLSTDQIHWQRETADFSFFPLAFWFATHPSPGILQFLFAAEPARYIKLVVLDENSCLLRSPLRVLVNII